MLRPDGFVKVLDFGLAKLASASEAIEATVNAHRASDRRGHGGRHGRLHVARAGARAGGRCTHRHLVARRGALRDGWRAGRRLPRRAAATRSRPSSTANPAACRFEPDAPTELQRILTKTLRKDRSQRYQTVQDLLLDLQALREELQSHAGPEESPDARSRLISTRTERPLHPSRRPSGDVAGRWPFSSWSPRPRRGGGETRSRVRVNGVATRAVERNLTRLTFGSGLQTDATFSPDGRFIAYASDRRGQLRYLGTADPWRWRPCRSRSRPTATRSRTGRRTGVSSPFRSEAMAVDCSSCRRSVDRSVGLVAEWRPSTLVARWLAGAAAVGRVVELPGLNLADGRPPRRKGQTHPRGLSEGRQLLLGRLAPGRTRLCHRPASHHGGRLLHAASRGRGRGEVRIRAVHRKARGQHHNLPVHLDADSRRSGSRSRTVCSPHQSLANHRRGRQAGLEQRGAPHDGRNS